MRPSRGMGCMSEKKLKKLKSGGLYENIHKKRARIKAGSGETMRKPGSKGAPTAEAFEQAAKSKRVQGIRKR